MNDGPRTSGRGDELGLRERKAAATRLAIAEALRRRLAETPLSEISVDGLAADANVSRVTFFNYFPTKEHAVDLLMQVWLFQIEIAVERRGLRGVAAIEHLFAALGDEVAAAPDRMRRIFGFFASRPGDRPVPALTKAERVALGGSASAPDEMRDLGAILVRFIEEAKRAGEIELVGTTYEFAHYLGALALGGALVGHSTRETDWRQLLRRHARRALGLLGARGKDPRPAAIPAKWRKKRKR